MYCGVETFFTPEKARVFNCERLQFFLQQDRAVELRFFNFWNFLYFMLENILLEITTEISVDP